MKSKARRNLFNTYLAKVPKYNHFDLSQTVKTTFNMGLLVPTLVMDVIPGDVHQISCEHLMRFAPLLSPMMHEVDIITDYYFVPNRLLWDEWEDFITGESAPTAPFIENSEDVLPGTLGNHLRYPTGISDSYTASAFPLAAYALIYDEWYRDQNNAPTEYFTPLIAGDNTQEGSYETLITGDPLRRAWEHDYFTSCLPTPQKGEDVILPLGDFSDVDVILGTTSPDQIVVDQSTTPITGASLTSDAVDGGLKAGANEAWIDPNGTLRAETSELQAQATDIRTVRTAFALQSWLERASRVGTRYVELLRGMFGVRPRDERFNRPEFITRSTAKMSISEVLSTADTTVPVGNLAGHGVSFSRGKRRSFYVPEHGWILGITNVQPRTGYMNGLHRSFTRETRFDYYWEDFAHIGEQAVLNREVNMTIGTGRNDTFGYIPRYTEYKFCNDHVAGEFMTSLDFWTLARKWDVNTVPVLNESFIQCNPSNRVFAVTAGDPDHIYAMIYHNIQSKRLIPKFNVPHIQ